MLIHIGSGSEVLRIFDTFSYVSYSLIVWKKNIPVLLFVHIFLHHYFYLYSSALNVQLSDSSFPESDFEVVHGNLNVQWSRLAPGSNVSHVVILRPLKSGYFNFTSAEVSYQPTEGAEAQVKTNFRFLSTLFMYYNE